MIFNQPPRRAVRIGSPATLLCLIPHILGFTPENSLVVLGLDPATGQIETAFRYDLPDPPDASLTTGCSQHAVMVLGANGLTTAIVVGYGPGTLVTPLADAMRQALRAAGIAVRDLLRVEDGRYWSYLCSEPSCCPPEGVQ